jgi:hypothetical protein
MRFCQRDIRIVLLVIIWSEFENEVWESWVCADFWDRYQIYVSV